MRGNLEAALDLAGRGLAVFPLHYPVERRDGLRCSCGNPDCRDQAKHPFGRIAHHGLKDATTDRARVTEWWRRYPRCNVGARTDRLVVLDVDPRHGGYDSLAALENAHAALPDTWTVSTGSNGRHFYFEAPPEVELRNTTGRLGAGLDTRAAGGYIIAPTSQHISGGYYSWLFAPDEVALAPLPQWLTDVLAKPIARTPEERAKAAADWHVLARNGVAVGRRHESLARVTGHLLRRNVDARVTLELMHAWNATRCEPPLEPAEVARIVNDISLRELMRRGAEK